MRALVLALALAGIGLPAAAQEPESQDAPRPIGALPKYGKWALLAGSVAMNLLAADQHHKGNLVYRELTDFCFTSPTACALGEDGKYLDPTAEQLYQRSVSYDKRSRAWLIGGETLLLGAAALFIYEFSRPKGLPPNKPFAPEVKRENGLTKVGVRFEF
jgi:hypothetical protein